jgi:hypothetical protein
MSICNVCAESHNKTNRYEVICEKCAFSACRTCIKTYLKSKAEDAHCMSCKHPWSRNFISDKFEKTYLNKEYKEICESILFDKEVAKLPDTQIHVENEMEIERLQQEFNNTLAKISALHKEQEQIQRKMSNIRHGNSSEERRKFVKKCPNGDCMGFLSSQWKCELCKVSVCAQCQEIKKTSVDANGNVLVHTCDESTLESVRAINKDSKPCPKCSAMIFKIHGCNQMFCTECKTAFNWSTLRIVTGNIHNPHFFEWRTQNQQQEVEAHQNPCNMNFNNLHIRIHECMEREYEKTKIPSIQNHRLFVDNFREIIQKEHCFITREPGEIIYEIESEEKYNRRLRTDYTKQKSITSIITRTIKPEFLDLYFQPNLVPAYPFIDKNLFLVKVVQYTLHIEDVEIARYPLGEEDPNLDLRIRYMRKFITKEYFQTEIQKRNKKTLKNQEIRNLLIMYVTCMKDLIFRIINSENILANFDGIMGELHHLRGYVNGCLKTIFTVYSSKVKHFIDERFEYQYKPPEKVDV